MSSYPDDRQYTADHEWIAVDGETARVGITAYAAEALGDVVYVDLPEAGTEIAAGETCGEIESTKSVSDLVAPATGEILAVNSAAVDEPETVGTDPHEEGWLYTLRVDELPDGLMDAEAYQTFVTGGAA